MASEKWLVTNCTLKTASCKRLRSRFRHESHHKRKRQTFGQTEFHFDDQILIDGDSEKSGEAFGHVCSASIFTKPGSSCAVARRSGSISIAKEGLDVAFEFFGEAFAAGVLRFGMESAGG